MNKSIWIVLLLSLVWGKTAAQCMLQKKIYADNRLRIDRAAVVNTTGNGVWDYQIDEAFESIKKFYKIDCRLYYVKGLANGVSEFANGILSIYLGIPEIQGYMQQKNGFQLVLGLIAHELSHSYQYSHQEGNPYFLIHSTDKWVELQADFMAAYALCSLRLMDEHYLSLYEWNCFNNEYGDYYFADTMHHGTPADRIKATKDGKMFCDQFLDTVYLRSQYYIKPSLRITQLNEKKLIADIQLKNGETYYASMDNEIFIKGGNGYEQVGSVQGVEEEMASMRWFIKLHGRVIVYVNRWDKVYDAAHNEIGKYTFYKQYFQTYGNDR